MTPTLFRRNLQAQLRFVNARLRRLDYSFTAYLQLLQSKGAGRSPREISLPAVRDRIALRVMAAYLRTVAPDTSVELPQSVVARVIGAMTEHSPAFFLRMDVQAFYPSIDHRWLQSRLAQRMPRADMVAQYMRAVTTPSLTTSQRYRGQVVARGVPQGLSISNALAELSVQHVDAAARSIAGVHYFRFVDDILMLGEEAALREAEELVIVELERAGLAAHTLGSGDKYALGSVESGFDFLGYQFEWPRVTVRRGSVQRLEASLVKAFTHYKYARDQATTQSQLNRARERLQWRVNLLVSGCVYEQTRRGWLVYFSQIRHQQLLAHLDYLVESLKRRHRVDELELKSFRRSYRYAVSPNQDKHGFVPNFDAYTVDEMRALLKLQFLDAAQVAKFDDATVTRVFSRRIRATVSQLERDIASDYRR